MSIPRVSEKMAHALAFLLFCMGIILLTYLKLWWPSLLLVVGFSLALKQYLLGKTLEMVLALLVFVSAYISAQFELYDDIILPATFIAGGLYLFLKGFFHKKCCHVPETNFHVEEPHEKPFE